MTASVTNSVGLGATAADNRGDPPAEAATVCEAFQRAVARYPDGAALRTGDDSVRHTWSQFDRRMRSVAAGLAGLGIGHGDTLATLLPNIPSPSG